MCPGNLITLDMALSEWLHVTSILILISTFFVALSFVSCLSELSVVVMFSLQYWYQLTKPIMRLELGQGIRGKRYIYGKVKPVDISIGLYCI